LGLLRPLVFKGFTRTKSRHIKAGQERLKEEHDVQSQKLVELEMENQILKREIGKEIIRSKKYFAGGAPEYKMRVREESNLNGQADLLRKDIEKVHEEILKIKKSQRYTTYQELRIFVEELQEESTRLKKLCKHMRGTRHSNIMKMTDRLGVQEKLMEVREAKLNEFTKELDKTKDEIKEIEKEIAICRDEEIKEQEKLKKLEAELQIKSHCISMLQKRIGSDGDGAKNKSKVDYQRYE
jgi:chromosome segregation ATPase